ncbi:MAG: thiol-disulfide oxidoreductase DCC family protein [Tabrizicola sp.]
MTEETRVLYNDTCPVCRFEIDAYRRRASADGLSIRFDPLDRAEDWGLTPDEAARQLHVWRAGRILSGMAAFRALWSSMPRWRWLAWLTGWPPVRPMADLVYERIAAPILYRAHLRRQRRR